MTKKTCFQRYYFQNLEITLIPCNRLLTEWQLKTKFQTTYYTYDSFDSHKDILTCKANFFIELIFSSVFPIYIH